MSNVTATAGSAAAVWNASACADVSAADVADDCNDCTDVSAWADGMAADVATCADIAMDGTGRTAKSSVWHADVATCADIAMDGTGHECSSEDPTLESCCRFKSKETEPRKGSRMEGSPV